MPDLSVNDAPPELLRRIERLARQQQRSVSAELIALIEAQRNYEVNSRTIRVSDEMMQQVGNLIR